MTQGTLTASRTRQRVFAELPYFRSWREIRQHVGRLAAAQVKGLYSDHGEPALESSYRKHSFSIRKRGAWLEFTIDETDDLESVLMHVQGHFASFLSPGLRDWSAASRRSIFDTARVAAY
jgi:hypothetical protein